MSTFYNYIVKSAVVVLFALMPGQKLSAQETRAKEITEELAANGRTIEINNQQKMDIEVASWEGRTIKIVYQNNREPFTVQTKLSALGFEIQNRSNATVLKIYKLSTGENGNRTPDGRPGSKAMIYVPEDKLVRLINSHAGAKITILLETNAEIEMTGGTLQVPHLRQLMLKATFTDVQLGRIGKANVEINAGQLAIDHVDSLVINSRYTQPVIGNAGSIHMTSLADNFTIREIGTLTGTKTYGSYIIGILKSGIDLTNSKAINIQVERILPQTRFIKINSTDDSYVLPVSGLKNYSISISAPGHTELWLTEAIRSGSPVKMASTGPVRLGGNGSKNFSSIVGGAVNQTLFELECNNCVIRFK